MFTPGEVVIYIPENKEYDFAYYSASKGKAIIYETGCCNMQDSYCVDIDKLVRTSEDATQTDIAGEQC